MKRCSHCGQHVKASCPICNHHGVVIRGKPEYKVYECKMGHQFKVVAGETKLIKHRKDADEMPLR